MTAQAPDIVIVAAWRPDGSFRVLEGEEAEEAKARAAPFTLPRSDGSRIVVYAVREPQSKRVACKRDRKHQVSDAAGTRSLPAAGGAVLSTETAVRRT